MFNQIKEHLSSNSGDTNISKMIMVAIVFVVGAIILVLTTSAFQGPIKGWYDHVVDEWFNHKNGQFSYFVDNNPGDGGIEDPEVPGVDVLPGGDDHGEDPYPTDPGGGFGGDPSDPFDPDDGPAGGNGGGDWDNGPESGAGDNNPEDDGGWDHGYEGPIAPTIPEV